MQTISFVTRKSVKHLIIHLKFLYLWTFSPLQSVSLLSPLSIEIILLNFYEFLRFFLTYKIIAFRGVNWRFMAYDCTFISRVAHDNATCLSFQFQIQRHSYALLMHTHTHTYTHAYRMFPTYLRYIFYLLLANRM